MSDDQDGCEWVSFFWYRPTRVVPDIRPLLNGCVCVCVCVCARALAEVVGCERTLHRTAQSGPNQPLAHLQRHVVVFRVAQL